MQEKELTEAQKKNLDRKIEQLEKKVFKVRDEYDAMLEELKELQ